MRRLLTLLLVLGLEGEALATPIILTHSGTGSGTIGSTVFSDAAFTITAFADTDNRFPLSHGFSLEHDSASISISGVGEFQFLSPTRTFLSRSIRIVGLSHGGSPYGSDLFDGPVDAIFSTWDLASPIGPVVGTGTLVQWNDESYPPMDTTGGILFFPYQDGIPTSFQATIVPEPGTLGLLAVGLLGIASRSVASRSSRIGSSIGRAQRTMRP